MKRNSKGQFTKGSIPWIKGRGMSEEKRLEHRKQALFKYNNSPERKAKVALYHQLHVERIREIKRKFSTSDKGYILGRKNAQKRISRINNLRYAIDFNYWDYLCKRLRNTCQLCLKQFLKKKLTIDHIIPITRGGDNEDWNIQPLCRSCNARKSNRIGYIFDNILLDIVYGDWLLLKKYGTYKVLL